MTNKNVVRFSTPGTYCIQVQGMLDDSWSDRLGGLEIRSKYVSEQSTITSLNGRLLDQAALLGVLNALYNMHYPLLSVEYQADADVDPSDG